MDPEIFAVEILLLASSVSQYRYPDHLVAEGTSRS